MLTQTTLLRAVAAMISLAGGLALSTPGESEEPQKMCSCAQLEEAVSEVTATCNGEDDCWYIWDCFDQGSGGGWTYSQACLSYEDDLCYEEIVCGG